MPGRFTRPTPAPEPCRPRRRAGILLAAIAVAAAASACGLSSSSPPGTERVESLVGRDVVGIDGFVLALEVAPARVRAGGSFDAWISVTNTGREDATWTTPYGCLAFLSIYRDGTGVPLEGSIYACAADYQDWELTPGGVAEMVVTVKTVVNGSRAPPGEYRVVANAFGAALEVPVLVTGDEGAPRRRHSAGGTTIASP